MDLTGAVTVRVASLCLQSTGRLTDSLLCGTAVRGALLLDLGLAGRVDPAEDSVIVDSTPTGFAPADRLLAAIAVEPERSLDDWLDERRIGLREVAAACVASGRWIARPGPFGFGRRYTDGQPHETARDRFLRPSADVVEGSPADACVAAIGVAAGLLDGTGPVLERPPDAVIRATGSTAWLCTAVVDHLLTTGARYRAQAGALGASSPF